MKTFNIIASGYKMKVEFPNGMNDRQRIYNDFVHVFECAINLLNSYPNDYPLNPEDRATYMRQSKICKNKIADLKMKFINGMINLNETQLVHFHFLIAREINESFYELYEKLILKFSYKRLHQHFREIGLNSIHWLIYDEIPFSEYHVLDGKFPKKASI